MRASCVLCDSGLPHGDQLCRSWDTSWLAPYRATSGMEDDARAAWTEIVDIACEHDGFAIALGAALGSIFLEPLGSRSFCLNLAGKDQTSTTQMLRAAMSGVGDPDRLVQPWVDPPSAFERLRHASILPVAFTGLDDVDERTLDRLLHGPDPAGADEQAWNLVVFASGRQRVRYAVPIAGGINWVEAPVPVVEDMGLVRRVHDLATAHHGWPLVWLAHHEALVDMPQWHPEAVRSLSASAPNVAARAMAKHLSACVVGFGALGRVVGRGLAVYAGIGAADQILSSLTAAAPTDPRQKQTAYLVGVTPAAGIPTS